MQIILYFIFNVIFYAVIISISLSILPEIVIRMVNLSKSYARKQKLVFFNIVSIFLKKICLYPALYLLMS